MPRKHPLWFLLPLALLLPLAACSSQAPDTDAPQEAAAYTVAPYTPTEQEQTLLQAYELTQDNTVAFTFQNPEEILGLFVQIYRLGEDGTWKNVDDIAVGSLLPPQAEGSSPSSWRTPRPSSPGSSVRAACRWEVPAPWRGTLSPGPRGSSPKVGS